MNEKTYIAIDLKSFYASVECAALSLDPLDTNLVVADESRTEKTICLAVSPSLKAYGIPGRARLFEVIEKVKHINSARKAKIRGRSFTGKSCVASRLAADPFLELDFLIAVPRMAEYIKVSTQIYEIYLKYIAPEDIHVYSIDEVFIDASGYLKTYRLSSHDFAMLLIKDVLSSTGITATAGIGTNLYLSKIAMDIVAKKMPADADGVRVAFLNEDLYRKKLWAHQPLTDFWRVGHGLARKLTANGLYTMGDIARCSAGKPTDYYNEDLLYRLFGINAELLIDHAWGWEPCTIHDIKAYRPRDSSIGSSQVLHMPYEASSARLLIKEMAVQLAESLIEKKLLTRQLVLSVSYDIENLNDPERMSGYKGEIVSDHYGRFAPKKAHGSINLKLPSSSPSVICEAAVSLYDNIVNSALLVRRLSICASDIIPESLHIDNTQYGQLDLFSDMGLTACSSEPESNTMYGEKTRREMNLEHAVIDIKKKHGKNAVLKGINLLEGATAAERNRQIGGHKA